MFQAHWLVCSCSCSGVTPGVMASRTVFVVSSLSDAIFSLLYLQLDGKEKEWMLASAACDYSRMYKLLTEQPDLAHRKDFITGVSLVTHHTSLSHIAITYHCHISLSHVAVTHRHHTSPSHVAVTAVAPHVTPRCIG